MASRDYRGYDDREELNAIQRDRIERRRRTRRKSMMSTVFAAAVIFVVAAGIVIAVVALGGRKNNTTEPAQPTEITATIAAAVSSPTTAPATIGNQQSEWQNTPTESSWQTDIPAAQDPALQPQYPTQEQQAGTPVSSGSALHYYAYGQTSYGYDWTYSGGAGVVNITCAYNFDLDQYDFIINGVSEGTTSFTLYYNTADDVQVPVTMTVSVDGDLNVTQIG